MELIVDRISKQYQNFPDIHQGNLWTAWSERCRKDDFHADDLRRPEIRQRNYHNGWNGRHYRGIPLIAWVSPAGFLYVSEHDGV